MLRNGTWRRDPATPASPTPTRSAAPFSPAAFSPPAASSSPASANLSQGATSSPGSKYKPPSRRQSLQPTQSNDVSHSWALLLQRLSALTFPSVTHSSLDLCATTPALLLATTTLYRLLEELKHSFTYPLPALLLPTSHFTTLLFILLPIVHAQALALLRLELNSTTADTATAAESSSVVFSPAAAPTYLLVEQSRLTLSTFFHLLTTWLRKRQLILPPPHSAPSPSSSSSTLPPGSLTVEQHKQLLDMYSALLFPLLEAEVSDKANATSMGRGWVTVDGIRCLSFLLFHSKHSTSNHCLSASLYQQLYTLLLPSLDLPLFPINLSNASPSSLPTTKASTSPSSSPSSSLTPNDGLVVTIQLEKRKVSIDCLSYLLRFYSPVPPPLALLAALLPRVLALIDHASRVGREPSSTSSSPSSSSTSSSTFISTLLSSLLHLLDTLLSLLSQPPILTQLQQHSTSSSSSPSSFSLENQIASLLSTLQRLTSWGSPLVLGLEHMQISPLMHKNTSSSSYPPAPASNGSSLHSPTSLQATQPNRLITHPPAHLFSPFATSASLFSTHPRSSPSSTIAQSPSGPSTRAESSSSSKRERVGEKDLDSWSNLDDEEDTASLHSSSSSHASLSAHRSAPSLALLDERVRVSTLTCLHTLASTSPYSLSLLSQYSLTFLLPTDRSSALSPRPFPAPHLLTLLLFDQSYTVRKISLEVLSLLLADSPLSKGLIGSGAGSSGIAGAGSGVGDGSGRVVGRERKHGGKLNGSSPLGGTTANSTGQNRIVTGSNLSARYSEIVRGIHAALLDSLQRETANNLPPSASKACSSLLPALLHSLSTLFTHIPYHHLSPTLTPSISPLLSPLAHLITSRLLLRPEEYDDSNSTSANSGSSPSPSRSHSRTHSRSHSKQHSRLGSPSQHGSLSPSRSSNNLLGAFVDSAAHHNLSLATQHMKSAVLVTLTALFSTSYPVAELSTYLSSPSSSATSLSLISLLVLHASSRKPTDPTPDAFTVLAALAHHYKASLAMYWRWNQSIETGYSLSTLLISTLFSGRQKKTGNPRLDGGDGGDMVGKTAALKLLEEWTRVDASALSTAAAAAVSSNSSGNKRTGGKGRNGEEVEHEDDGGGGGGGEHGFEPSSLSPFFALEGVNDLYVHHLPLLYREHSIAAAVASSTTQHQQLQQMHAVFRAKVLHCLSFLPYSLFSSLPFEARSTLIDCVKHAAKDASATSVRVAACQSLSLFALYLSRTAAILSRTGTSATSNVDAVAFADLLTLLIQLLSTPQVQAVRVRASWAIANLVDYSTNGTNGDENSRLSLPSLLLSSPLTLPSLIQLLLSTSISDKLAANSLRALGNLAFHLPLVDVVPVGGGNSMASVWCAVVHRLVEAMGSDGRAGAGESKEAQGAGVRKTAAAGTVGKMRVNAVYAVSNALKNESIPAITVQHEEAKGRQTILDALDTVFSALLYLVQQEQTHLTHIASLTPTSTTSHAAALAYKIHLTALHSLASPPSFAHFPSLTCYLSVLAGMRQQLQHVNEWKAANVREIKQREAVRDSLKKGVLHLLTLLPEREAEVENEAKRDNYDRKEDAAAASSKNSIVLEAVDRECEEHVESYAGLILQERIRLEKERNRAKLSRLTRGSGQPGASSPVVEEVAAGEGSEIESAYRSFRARLREEKRQEFDAMADGRGD